MIQRPVAIPFPSSAHMYAPYTYPQPQLQPQPQVRYPLATPPVYPQYYSFQQPTLPVSPSYYNFGVHVPPVITSHPPSRKRRNDYDYVADQAPPNKRLETEESHSAQARPQQLITSRDDVGAMMDEEQLPAVDDAEDTDSDSDAPSSPLSELFTSKSKISPVIDLAPIMRRLYEQRNGNDKDDESDVNKQLVVYQPITQTLLSSTTAQAIKSQPTPIITTTSLPISVPAMQRDVSAGAMMADDPDLLTPVVAKMSIQQNLINNASAIQQHSNFPLQPMTAPPLNMFPMPSNFNFNQPTTFISNGVHVPLLSPQQTRQQQIQYPVRPSIPTFGYPV